MKKQLYTILAGTAILASISISSCKGSDNKADMDDTATAQEDVDITDINIAETNINEISLPEDTADIEKEMPTLQADSAKAAVADAKTTASDPVAKKYASAKVDHTGFTTTPSGLMYKQVRPGKGPKPSSPSTVVKVHYTGKLLDGTVFDSSYERNEPIDFPLNRVIKGWTEGVQLMNVGSKYEFIIPAALAYGAQGTPGGPIGPNQDLYFEVELLGIQ